MASEQHQETSSVHLKLSNDRFHGRKDIWGLVNQYQTESYPHGENIQEFSICYGMPEASKSYIAQYTGEDLDLTRARTTNTIVIFNSSEEGKQFMKWLDDHHKEIQAQLMPFQVFSHVEATVHPNLARAIFEKHGREYVNILLRDRAGLTISEGTENFKIIGNHHQVDLAEFLLGQLYQTTVANKEYNTKQSDEVSPISLDKPGTPDIKKEDNILPDSKQEIPQIVPDQENVPSTSKTDKPATSQEPATSPKPDTKFTTSPKPETEKIIHAGKVDITMPQEQFSLKNRLSFFEQKLEEQIIKRPLPVVERTPSIRYKELNQVMGERNLSDASTGSPDYTKLLRDTNQKDEEQITERPPLVAKRTSTYRDFEQVMRERRISDSSSDNSEFAKISEDITQKDEEKMTKRLPLVAKRRSTYRDFEEVMREMKISGSSDSSVDAKSPKNNDQKVEEQIICTKRPPPRKYKDFEQAMRERKISSSSSDNSDDTNPWDINQNHEQDPTFGPDSGEGDILAEESEILETEIASPTQPSVDSFTHTTKALVSVEVCSICQDICGKEKVLNICKHVFCEDCIDKSFIEIGAQCPVCRTSYRCVDVEMTHERDIDQLPGHDRFGTIIIKYTLPDSQDKYLFNGDDPKKVRAYLPDSPEGNYWLKYLDKANKAGKTFKTRDSLIPEKSLVVWQGKIPHKTQRTGGPDKHGYPDETYLLQLGEALTRNKLYDPSPQEAIEYQQMLALTNRAVNESKA